MEQFMQQNWWIGIVLMAWLLPWKGVALWKAARNSQLKWFIAILVLNTFAILDIFYIFVIAKKIERAGKKEAPSESPNETSNEESLSETSNK